MSYLYSTSCHSRHWSDDHPMPAPPLSFHVFRKLDAHYRRRCPCCKMKFIEESCFESPCEGYATPDDAIWVCTHCAPHYAKGLVLQGGPKRKANGAPAKGTLSFV